jgi:hypothetical protein
VKWFDSFHFLKEMEILFRIDFYCDTINH